MQSEAEKKFWGCPKLMENLLPFLDTYSIICLARVNTLLQIPYPILNTNTITNTKFTIPKYQLHYIQNQFLLPFLLELQLHHLPCSGPQACPGRHPG